MYVPTECDPADVPSRGIRKHPDRVMRKSHKFPAKSICRRKLKVKQRAIGLNEYDLACIDSDFGCSDLSD